MIRSDWMKALHVQLLRFATSCLRKPSDSDWHNGPDEMPQGKTVSKQSRMQEIAGFSME